METGIFIPQVLTERKAGSKENTAALNNAAFRFNNRRTIKYTGKILKEENTKLKEQLTSKDLIIISSKKKLEESETSFAASKRNCENIQKAYDGNKDLIAMLNKYIFDKSIIIERLVKNLTDITKAGIFSRRDIAVKSLKNYEDFIINQNKIK